MKWTAVWIVLCTASLSGEAAIETQINGQNLQFSPRSSGSFASRTLDKLAAWLPGLDTLNPSFGSSRSRKGLSSEEDAPKAIPVKSKSLADSLVTGAAQAIPKLESVQVALDAASPDAGGRYESHTKEEDEEEKLEGKPEKKPLPALRKRQASPWRNSTEGAGNLRGRYRHHFQDMSGFNESLAARDGQAAKSKDVTEIASGELSLKYNRPGEEPGPLPMVALMFLTRGALPHEETWRLFLESIPSMGNSHGAAWQSMFSIYVHPGLDVEYPAGSLLSGKAIHKRVKVEWGQFSVVRHPTFCVLNDNATLPSSYLRKDYTRLQMQAEINLMEEALKQPFNERFVLLSETCIPLYPATFVWAQLLSEAKSRIHACAKLGDSDDESRRMTYRMHGDMIKDGLQRDHWRKSGQWIALTRQHAEVVANDTIVSKLFKDECWVDTEHQPLWRFCVSDEHYAPTLLAYLGLDNETDCIGSVTNAWWDGPYFHPRTWTAKDISQDLMMKLRKSNHGFEANADINCNDEDAMQSLRLIFPNQRSKESRSRRSRGLQHVAAIATKRTDFQENQTQAEVNSLSVNQSPHEEGSRSHHAAEEYSEIRHFGHWGGSEAFWRALLVLQPGSLPWWQYLDDRGINGETLLPDPHIPSDQTLRRILRENGSSTLNNQEGAHWEAARQLLAAYQPMRDTNCPLFARKFDAADAASIALLARNFTTPAAHGNSTGLAVPQT